MDYRDYYATLGVKRDATPAEIKRAFRKLARQHHPDLKPGDKAAEARFKEINEANEVLSDPDKRSKYDMLGANWEALSQAGAGRRGAPGGRAAAGDPFGPGGQFAGFSQAPAALAAMSATSSGAPATAAASATSSGRSSERPVGRRPRRPAAVAVRDRSAVPASRTSWPASTSRAAAPPRTAGPMPPTAR